MGETAQLTEEWWSAEIRARGIQAKLHRWACQNPDRRFDDLFPKPGRRKCRRLGIPTVTDRVVQASLKLVLGTDLRG